MRRSFKEIYEKLFQILREFDFPEDRARLIAHTHTQSSCDGVYSHGLNRFPLFIDYVERGLINIAAEPEKMGSFGALERWDGKLAPGVSNAHQCMERAMELAKDYTLGCVALRNTNHWMRGGTYGWQAADAGKIAVCFTNTKPNMPPWGGRENRIGNNPFVIAIPRTEGHVVLDMATSQFSLGKMNAYKLNNKQLPFAGGWDEDGNLTKDPEKILDTGHALPTGYWKGSALTIVLDMLAALLSDGKPTHKIDEDKEIGISQIFICIDPSTFSNPNVKDLLLDEIIHHVHDVSPMNQGDRTYYPGERTLATRKDHLEHGIPVIASVWEDIIELGR
ncbi:3-dehydro-L-gulonate 2-dehydrogenase [Aliifodinibius sp. S!AR15-10]|uniref:3-dehydro-L-gulonate 2-dehydrogenase n=1 Tax=Aliifodinibius sp. S!AR15-10 TaxID=2950437 RepID=UPI00285BFFC5|nr:3-dehydro-L-gulonate 2-dehydrogenase [Aliifodinibius sp. S!AR15-10]MDR8389980.1 3-dehydro-L-gulonate 2-dehydrogenase [Aliifodinibius sp. S!AR15-10]